jgi:hypothetical protein
MLVKDSAPNRLNGWPLLLVDLNAEEKITGIEFVGAKQFGVKHFAELLRGMHNRLVPDSQIPMQPPMQWIRSVATCSP